SARRQASDGIGNGIADEQGEAEDDERGLERPPHDAEIERILEDRGVVGAGPAAAVELARGRRVEADHQEVKERADEEAEEERCRRPGEGEAGETPPHVDLEAVTVLAQEKCSMTSLDGPFRRRA